MQTAPPPTPSLTVERFIDRLYAQLAWEGTVRLGDPAIASRLVERVLHRAWDERDRFTTPDALIRHTRDSALGAITREAERRLDVTRFEEGAMLPTPGNLWVMSAESVAQRLMEGRRLAPTPAMGIPVVTPAMVPEPVVVRPVAPTPVAAPVVPAPLAPAAVAAAPVAPAAAAATPSTPTPRTTGSFATPRVSTAMPATSEHANAGQGTAEHRRTRPTLRSASYIKPDEKPKLSTRTWITIGSAAAVVALVVWRLASSPAAEATKAPELAAATTTPVESAAALSSEPPANGAPPAAGAATASTTPPTATAPAKPAAAKPAAPKPAAKAPAASKPVPAKRKAAPAEEEEIVLPQLRPIPKIP